MEIHLLRSAPSLTPDGPARPGPLNPPVTKGGSSST